MRNKSLLIFTFFLLLSCTTGQGDDGKINEESFTYLLKSLRQNIDDYNNTHSDSISTEMITLDKRTLSKDDFEFLILETISHDKKRYQAILGIKDSIKTGFPYYTFTHNQKSEFKIDDIQNLRDSLIFYGTFKVPDEISKFKLSYDKNFNGKSEPWSISIYTNGKIYTNSN